MPTALHIARFSPQTASPAEAYDRGTRTPREVRQLAETLVGWVLSNLAHDVVSPFGDLPRRFGFACELTMATMREAPYHILLAPALRLFILDRRIVCAHSAGSTVLRADRFEFQRTKVIPLALSTEIPRQGIPPVTPADWVLGWASLARTFGLFARYERWVIQNFGPGFRHEGDCQRPRTARQSTVPLLELPLALDGMAEWCLDSEQAMLTWVIADARRRGMTPEIPTL